MGKLTEPLRLLFAIPAFRALRNPPYRTFMLGQFVSLTGNWFQITAQTWLVSDVLKAGAFRIGFFGFAAQFPILIFGLMAGIVADHGDRRRLLILTQFLFAIQAAMFAALTLISGHGHAPLITYSSAVALAIVGGIIQSFDLPARQTFLLELVPKEDIANAVALNSLAFNATRVIGPAGAGFVIGWVSTHFPDRPGAGEGVCFIVNVVTFAAVLLSLFLIKPTGRIRPERTGSTVSLALEGLKYIRERAHLSALLLHLSFMSLFGVPYLTLIPVFVKMVFSNRADSFGNMLAAVGAGALVGGGIMAWRKSVRGLGAHMIAANIGFAMACLALALCRSERAALLILGCAGFFMVMTMIASQTLAQVFVTESVRGRVMSIYSMIAIGLFPVGSLLSGGLAEWLGVRQACAINAAVCGLAGLYYAFRLPALRRSARASDEYQLHITAESGQK